nr:hypothetical protein HK105_002846 [Polyrhizophydium stewartii]
MDTFDPTASLSPADSTLAFGGGGSSGTFRTGSGAGMNSELSRTDSRNALRASLRSESVADMDSNFGGAHDDDDDDDMADTSLMTGVYSSNSDIISFPPVGPDTRPPARISVTGFERRLPSKIKRHEYEPIPGGILLNISAPALTRPRDWLGSRSRPHSSSSEAFSHPSWFSLGAISPIELNAFPYRFAQGPMQEAALREYALLRNQIIEQARQSPGSYLSVADCAAKHSTDIVFAASVHAFLECHGIINATTLHIQGPVASSVLQFDELRSSQQERDASSNALSPQALLFDESRGRQPELRTLPQQLSIEQFVCCICASDCFAVRYEGVKHPGMIFCQDCFAKGRFPSDLFSKDFARRYGPLLGPPVGSTAPWTDEEMLALVESIERNGCDWDLVAEDVPSRSSRECAQRFLEMSIAETPRREQTAHTSDDADYKELVGLIVGDCPNPVMSLVHILASGAHPVIAAEAARISLSVLASADAQAESDMKALVLQAAASALKGSCELARIFAEREVTKLKWYVRQLVKEQLNRIAVKIEYLET